MTPEHLWGTLGFLEAVITPLIQSCPEPRFFVCQETEPQWILVTCLRPHSKRYQDQIARLLILVQSLHIPTKSLPRLSRAMPPHLLTLQKSRGQNVYQVVLHIYTSTFNSQCNFMSWTLYYSHFTDGRNESLNNLSSETQPDVVEFGLKARPIWFQKLLFLLCYRIKNANSCLSWRKPSVSVTSLGQKAWLIFREILCSSSIITIDYTSPRFSVWCEHLGGYFPKLN